MIVKLSDYKLLGNPRNCIYKITNPSGNIYIGKTVSLNNRIKEYISLRCNHQTILFNSLKYHGIFNHTIEVIEKNIGEDNLIEREIYYIEYFDTYKKGMNMTIGGEGNSKYSDDFCFKLLKLNHQGIRTSEIAKEFNILPGVIRVLIKRVGEYIQNEPERSPEAKIKHSETFNKRYKIPEFALDKNNKLKKVIPISHHNKDSDWKIQCVKLYSKVNQAINSLNSIENYEDRIINGKTITEWDLFIKSKKQERTVKNIIPKEALNEGNVLQEVIPKCFSKISSDWHKQCRRLYDQIKGRNRIKKKKK